VRNNLSFLGACCADIDKKLSMSPPQAPSRTVAAVGPPVRLAALPGAPSSTHRRRQAVDANVTGGRLSLHDTHADGLPEQR